MPKKKKFEEAAGRGEGQSALGAFGFKKVRRDDMFKDLEAAADRNKKDTASSGATTPSPAPKSHKKRPGSALQKRGRKRLQRNVCFKATRTGIFAAISMYNTVWQILGFAADRTTNAAATVYHSVWAALGFKMDKKSEQDQSSKGLQGSPTPWVLPCVPPVAGYAPGGEA